MIATFLSLVPALLVLASVLVIKRLHYALLIGLTSAALIASQGSITSATQLISTRFISQISDIDNLYLYGFLLVLGILIALIEHTGGTAAFARFITKKVTNARDAQTASMLLSLSFCIDDYLSCLATGHIMRPIMDRFAVSRTKLAFLIHSLSSPMVMIAPLSTWIAMITTQIEQAGVSMHGEAKITADPYVLFLKSIPFIFYSFLVLFSIWIIVRWQLSYGPMTQEERHTQTHPHKEEKQISTTRSTSAMLLAPLATLLASFIGGIAYFGNYWLFGGPHTFVEALTHNEYIPLILVISGLLAIAVGIGFGIRRKVLPWSKLPLIIKGGFGLMTSSITLIFLASTLGLMMRVDLATGTHVASALTGVLQAWLLPVTLYITATIVALITGSAWGTIALLVPIAVQMVIYITQTQPPVLPEQLPLLLPVLGALFSGAVCGNHLSPLSETTIMSANSSGCDPMTHAITQFWYMLPAVFATICAFIVAGHATAQNYDLLTTGLLGIGTGILICILLLTLLQTCFKPGKS